MNYDFKNRWKSDVIPLLELPIVKECIKKGITKWLASGCGWSNDTYDENRCPASYGRGDSWVNILCEYMNSQTKLLLEEGILEDDINYINCDDKDMYQGSLLQQKYEDYKNNILEPYINNFIKTDYRAYQMRMACHIWNPTFCLTLAELIYPEEDWYVVSSEIHTTVVNEDFSLVFDILYYNETDEFFGGKEAINDAYLN